METEAKDPLRIRRRHVREAVERHHDLILMTLDTSGAFLRSFLNAIRDDMRAGASFADALAEALEAFAMPGWEDECASYADSFARAELDEFNKFGD